MLNSTNCFNDQIGRHRLLFTLVVWLLTSGSAAFAQDGFFVPLTSAQARLATPELDAIEKYGLYQLKTTSLRNYLAKAPLENRATPSNLRLAIPLPDGTTELFVLAESPILAPAIAAQYPDIKTYTGKGVTHTTYTIRLSLTSGGFDAIILGVDNSTVYITKVTGDSLDQRYATYFARDAKKNDTAKPFGSLGQCGTLSPTIEALPEKSGANARTGAALNNTGTTLRMFRLALSATKEFTQQKGGGTVDGAFNAIVGYVNRMNAVYRVELSVAFTLVSGKGTIFTAGADGGLDNKNLESMLDRNQTILDNAVGDTNYDIGHVLGNSGGSGEGLAQSPAACISGTKAKGATSFGDGSFAPIFDDQTLSHEVGHQFGMSHTFNSVIPVCTTREAKTSVEPGAGTTIMSYGYTCSDDKNPARNDDYESTLYQPILNFHTVSYQQAATYIATLSCFTTTNLTNAVPVISNFPSNIVIPKSTPFSLSATATDANADDKLSYSWEGTNIGTEIPDAATLANTAKPPFFRSYAPVAIGTRTYPRLDAILNGSNYAKGDKLPSVGITTTHVLTVRDNVGGVTFQGVTVTIADNSGPFLETTNLSGSRPANSLQTITWNVANTTAPPVNCASVSILLSTDGGQTFPITLLADTPNDGNESIRFPDIRTTQGRIKIVSSNSIFFDISNTNFTIGDPIVLTGAPLVNVNSTDPSASEGGSKGGGRRAAIGARQAAVADPGIIRFERSSTQGPLVVNYQIEGTATNGVDFSSLPTSVTFADGQAVVTEEVDPLEDDLVEDDETIVITLLDSDAYDPDPDNLTTTVTIKDRPPFAITGVTLINCQTVSATQRQITFTPQYTGVTGESILLAITTTSIITTQPGPYNLTLSTDQPLITLIAQQGAVTSAYNYTWLAACNTGPTPNRPPTTTGIPAQAAQQGQAYSLGLATYFSDPDGQSLNYLASSLPAGLNLTGSVISGTPSVTGTFPISATAVDPGGLFISTNFQLTINDISTPVQSFALTGVTTFNCQNLGGNQQQVSFTPQYTGITGQQIVLAMTNGYITTQPGPYSQALSTDQPLLTLIAQQGTVTSAYNYNWLAACNAGGRVASLQEATGLQVLALGNPVTTHSAEVEIRGVAGQRVQLEMLDMQGRRWHQQTISQATSVEQVSVPLGSSRGVLLLQVSSGGQTITLKLIQAN